MIARRPGVLLGAALCVVLAACGSNTPVVPSASGATSTSGAPTTTATANQASAPTQPGATNPGVTAQPGSSTEPGATAAPTPAESPVPGGSLVPGPTPPPDSVSLPMPGFAAYAPIQMKGTDTLASATTDLSCDALVGWMQAGDWRLDADALNPLPSGTPDPGGLTFPRLRWLALSRPTEVAIVKLASTNGGLGCEGSISRLSRQPFQATGSFTSNTSALAYQLACQPGAQSVTVASLLFGDDGSLAFVSAEVPLKLGPQSLLDGSLQMGMTAVTPANLVQALANGDFYQEHPKILNGLIAYGRSASASGTATVTSIDPFIATVAFTGIQDPSGGQEALTTGLRCDVGDHLLAQWAIPPVATPPPTIAPAGHLEVTVGGGASAYSRSVDGPEVTCSYGLVNTKTWDLRYSTADASGFLLDLYIPPKDEPSLLISDGDVYIQVEKARVGGTLTATVDDRGTEVDFTANGKTPDGRAVTLTATCGAISRA